MHIKETNKIKPKDILYSDTGTLIKVHKTFKQGTIQTNHQGIEFQWVRTENEGVWPSCRLGFKKPSKLRDKQGHS